MTLLAANDLFQRARAKATGVWKLGLDPHRMIFLDHGDIVFAQSTWPQDRLTSLLVERSLLTQAQLDYALANLKPGISVGKNLIDMGFITQRVLLDVARLQVERVVFGAMATDDEEPAFDERELDANVVRLPFETPLLLLNGILGLQDREQVLEWLGPLNQVVVGEGRKLVELTLPADLAKLPPLLDGTRTLLELARESGVEPLRFGSFALFLREMGWAKLHELPPLDRAAMDLALAQEPEPPSLPLPEPTTQDLAPSLFASIEAAAKPTTNLEHLSQALDALPEPEEALEPPALEDPFIEAEAGQATLPTPQELPPLDEEDLTPPEPKIHMPLVEEELELPPAPTLETPQPPARSLIKPLVVLFCLGLLGYAGWMLRGRFGRSKPTPDPALVLPAQTPEPTPEPRPQPPSDPKPEVEPAPETKPEPKPEPKQELKDSPAARLAALTQGDLAQARALSDLMLKQEPKGWTLRLLIACLNETVQTTPKHFPGETPNLFLQPIHMRDGKTCHQVFYGVFPTEKAAQEAIAKLPEPYRVKGNRPRAFPLADLPQRQ